MSLANRIRQYKMFMERGQKKLAEQQVKDHPELLKETEEQTKSKGKK